MSRVLEKGHEQFSQGPGESFGKKKGQPQKTKDKTWNILERWYGREGAFMLGQTMYRNASFICLTKRTIPARLNKLLK